jgi:hypothetical protein
MYQIREVLLDNRTEEIVKILKKFTDGFFLNVSIVKVGESIDIEMSTDNNPNLREIISTVTHEMCHQAVVEIDKFVEDDIRKVPENMPYEMKMDMNKQHGFHFPVWGKRRYEKLDVEVHVHVGDKNTKDIVNKTKELDKEQTNKHLEVSEREWKEW